MSIRSQAPAPIALAAPWGPADISPVTTASGWPDYAIDTMEPGVLLVIFASSEPGGGQGEEFEQSFILQIEPVQAVEPIAVQVCPPQHERREPRKGTP
jgi:hypothetical protein